jgi:peptidyl-prolyl isomerase G (cyclophilin G)
VSDNEEVSNPVRRRKHLESDSSERGRSKRRRKKSKHKTDRSITPEDSPGGRDKGPVAETEEEYDARLEREENERREAARKNELEGIRKQYAHDAQSTNGVRFKGLFRYDAYS